MNATTTAAEAATTVATDDIVTCIIKDGNTVVCNGTTYLREGHDVLTYEHLWFWIFLAIYVFLVLFAGIMSGLTLGLLSLDKLSLRVISDAGTAKQRKYANRILPLVTRHHHLLVTLLLANAVAVEGMPLCLDRISDPITAILVSVSAVLLFGEVFPQALCSRYGLAIGAYLSPLVYFLMVVLSPIAWPISKLLDCMLGQGHHLFFGHAELKALVNLHGPQGYQSSEDSGPLSEHEVLVIKGALEMKDKVARDAMVPLQSVFMLDANKTLDNKTISEVLRVSHSRVPVYEGSKDNVKGVLLMKTLLGADSKQRLSISALALDGRYSTQPTSVWEDAPLYDLLSQFYTGKCHLMLVRQRPYSPTGSKNFEGKDLLSVPSIDQAHDGALLGIITLEDVLEELLQEEIRDETDVYADVYRRTRLARARAQAMRFVSMEGSTERSMKSNFSALSQEEIPLLMGVIYPPKGS